ncbi:ABC transporter permease [Nocardioides sp. KC13]|uniref:ABC transporter permease n=1 Tax=Nocardioides turkmenicus TaxID=2711220 RepID=A0A6M1RI17_9ACTN|nr:ABC transporter permease [Nocardioides sp. KC13]NGN95847.1 ABC transporter permease [Nocardioides sp. KC13]
MRPLIISEVHKLFSTRLWLWLLLASMALAALYASLLIGFSDDPDTMTAPLDSPAGQQTLFAVASGGANTLVAVLAAIGVTGEFRHRTATATFLATPRRRRVVLAKLLVYVAAGVGYAIACLVVVASIAWPWLSAKGIDLGLLGEGLPSTYAGVVADVTLFAMVGVGLGALVRNQVATVVGLLVYRFVAEPMVTAVPALSDWTAYLPGSASAALTQVSLSTQNYLDPWLGGLVLTGYGLLLVIVGARVSVGRDVT